MFLKKLSQTKLIFLTDIYLTTRPWVTEFLMDGKLIILVFVSVQNTITPSKEIIL